MRHITHIAFYIFTLVCVVLIPSPVLAQGAAALVEGLPGMAWFLT